MSRLFKTICKNGGIISQSKKQLNFALFHTSTKTFQSEEPFILKSKFEDVPLSKDTFGDFMWSNANKYQTRTALVSFFIHTELFLNSSPVFTWTENATFSNFDKYLSTHLIFYVSISTYQKSFKSTVHIRVHICI